MRAPLLLILLLSACGGEGAGASDPYVASGDPTDTEAPRSLVPAAYSGVRDTFFLHATMGVHAEPGDSAAVVQVLPPGEPVALGPKDEHGWAPVIDEEGARIGYLYRASDDVRSYAPEEPGGEVQRAMSPGAAREYHRGPRGGCYTYSANGRKRYVDRSYCD